MRRIDRNHLAVLFWGLGADGCLVFHCAPWEWFATSVPVHLDYVTKLYTIRFAMLPQNLSQHILYKQ